MFSNCSNSNILHLSFVKEKSKVYNQKLINEIKKNFEEKIAETINQTKLDSLQIQTHVTIKAEKLNARLEV